MMLKKNILFLIAFLTGGLLLLQGFSSGIGGNGLGDRTDGPLSSNTCGQCHTGNASSSANETVVSMVLKDGSGVATTSYSPGVNHGVEITVTNPLGSLNNYGVQAVALTSTNQGAGSYTIIQTPNTQTSSIGGVPYLEHSGASSTGLFKAVWTAPSSGTGTICFYIVGLAVNGNSSSDNSDIMSSPITFCLTEAGATSVGISYTSASFCQGSGTHSPTITGTTGGLFSSTSGLVMDPSSGVIDADNSTAGNYVITYTAGGLSATANIEIVAAPDASFVYSSSYYCKNSMSAPSPNITTNGGSFSSTAGLVIDASTGAINLTNSVVGNYIVTYSVLAGNCQSTSTKPIEIKPGDEAVFIGAPYQIIIDQAVPPVNLEVTTNVTGAFISTPAGLIFSNSTTGEIDLVNSQAGNYTILYTTTGPCPIIITTTLSLVISVNTKDNITITPKVYPSPSSSKVFIEGLSLVSENNIEVFDIRGTQLLQATVSNNALYDIDISSYAQGLYFIHVTANNNNFTYTILKD